MQEVGSGAARLDLKLQIGSFKLLTFVFDEDISGKTFGFYIKKYSGARPNAVKYTNNNGITIPIYTTDRIEVRIQGAATEDLEEGEYYWELRREDLDAPKVFGVCYFSYQATE